MRIIANDVTPEMGSEGSNPSLSASARIQVRAFFVPVLSGWLRYFSHRLHASRLLPCQALRSIGV